MLNVDKNDESAQKKLDMILCEATEAVPSSVSLWHARTKHLLLSGREGEAAAIFPKVK